MTEDRQEQIVKLCQELIRRKSYSGQENAVVEKLEETFRGYGFDDVSIDEYGSIVGHIKGKGPGKRLLFDGHMDTVPVPEPSQWRHDPFGGEIEAGRIYGRGASDMKGALSAMVCAAAFFREDFKREFSGDIFVAGVVHEECFEGIASRKISAKINPDYVLIGEASGCNIKRGQKGRAEIMVETFGKPAHSANPEKGINAVYMAAKIIDRIKKLEVIRHNFMGQGILELTDIQSSPYPGASVVPDYCRMTYDRRLLVGETKEGVLKPVLAVLEELEKEDPEFKARVSYASGREQCYTGESIEGERYFPAWLLEEDDEYVQMVVGALKSAGLDPVISYYPFCTNGSYYAGEAGIRTVGFGPSLENMAHTIDEYIEINQLIKAAQGYYAIIKKILA